MLDFGKLCVECPDMFGEAQTTLHVNASAPPHPLQCVISSLKSVLNYARAWCNPNPDLVAESSKAGETLGQEPEGKQPAIEQMILGRKKPDPSPFAWILSLGFCFVPIPFPLA